MHGILSFSVMCLKSVIGAAHGMAACTRVHLPHAHLAADAPAFLT